LFEFYRSDEWETFRQIVINERVKEDGFVYDEVTGKPIVKAYDIILHHVEELTEENVKDANIALNPANIIIVSHKTHNILHRKLEYKSREVYLVYGSPLSGKSTWVHDNMDEGDLVVDIDNIWECVSGCDRNIKPKRLNAVVFKMRDTLIDAVKYRLGRWRCAYIVGGYPLQSERDLLCRQTGAREVFIDTPKQECLERIKGAGRDEQTWSKYINDWFDRYDRANG
jgi:predicted kinase